MRVSVHDLNPTMKIAVSGSEPWLSAIYGDFPPPGDLPPTTRASAIMGELTMLLETGGSVLVTGHLSFTPVVSCSRCDSGIPWPISVAIQVRYMPPAVNTVETREKTLRRAELDAHFLEDGCVNVEELVNEAIQTGLPNRFLATTDDGSTCRICLVDLSSEQVYRDPNQKDEATPASPFAVLSGLKLPN